MLLLDPVERPTALEALDQLMLFSQTQTEAVAADGKGSDASTSKYNSFEESIKIKDSNMKYYPRRPVRSGSNIFEAEKMGVKKENIVIKFITDFVEKNEREVQHLIDAGDSNHVVKHIDSGFCEYNYQKAIYIAMERCETGTLAEKIENDCPSYDIRKNYLRCIAEGLRHLKEKQIFHRDLKPSNILFRNGSAVISDFGLSKKHPENKSKTVQSIPNVGTDGWRAPETSEEGCMTSYVADIYSAGLVFHYTVTGAKHPYDNGKNRAHRQALIDFDNDGTKCNLEDLYKTPDGAMAFDLIESMLRRDPKERPSIEAVLKHPFFFNAEEKLRFLSTAHATVEYIEILKKNTKKEFTALDLNVTKNAKYGQQVENELKNWNREKLMLTDDEKAAMENNFKQKRAKVEVDKDVMIRKARSKKGKQLVNESVVDLLRFIRNRDTHGNEDKAEKNIDMTKEQFMKFFSDRFPHFFIYVFRRFQRYYSKKKRSDVDFYAPMRNYFSE